MTRLDTVYAWVLALCIVVMGLIAIATYEQVQDVQQQLEHIDSHFRAPEPTPRSQEVTG